MQKKLLSFVTGALWLFALLSFFPGFLPLIITQAPAPQEPTTKKVVEVSANRCRSCTPHKDLSMLDIAHEENQNAERFSCVITKTGTEDIFKMPFFETNRLAFYTVKNDDVNDLHKLLSNPQTVAHTTMSRHRSLHETRTFLAKLHEGYRIGDTVPWGVYNKATRRLIGLAGYGMWYPDEAMPGKSHNVGGRITTKLYLHPKEQGKGLEAEIYRGLVEYGMTHPIFRFRRVEAILAVDDAQRIQAAQAAGMLNEGTFHDRHYIDGKPVSFHCMAVIKDDISLKIKRSRA